MSEIHLQPIEKLRKDLRQAAALMSPQQVRYLVDLYYQIQEFRKATANQQRAMSETEEPVNVIGWAFGSMETIEKEIKRGLEIYTDSESSGMGQWAKSVCGIGPVISAGLLAHIDMDRAESVSDIWRFAGLDPTAKWEKGQKRPHNAALKTLCWKIGESFVKVSGNEADVYGKVWLERKAYEIEKNERGEYAEQCPGYLSHLRDKNCETAKTLKEGRLSAGILHSRSKRYAVKRFLSHWWAEAYRRKFGKEPPEPYAIAHLGHVHKV